MKSLPIWLAGTACLLVDGYDQAILIDARSYPARSVEEPEADKVLRGSHDGFTETIVQNTALIRRRIRDVNLRVEISRIGGKSKTDVVLCYMANKVNPQRCCARYSKNWLTSSRTLLPWLRKV